MNEVNFQHYVLFMLSGNMVCNTTFAGTSIATLTVPAGTNKVLLQVETADVRVRWDGTAPTASAGLLLKAAGTGYPGWYEFNYTTAVSLSMIAVSGTPSINAVYYQGQ